MALILPTRKNRRARLKAEEADLQVRVEALRGQLARDHAPITFHQGPFQSSFSGDSDAATKFIRAIKGTASQAIGVRRDRIQSLPLGAFARRSVGGEIEDIAQPDHPLQRILDNPTMDPLTGISTHSASQFYGMISTHLDAIGESYALINENGSGMPQFLQLVPPGALSPVVNGSHVTEYEVHGSGRGAGKRIPATSVIRIWQPDPENLFGARGIMSRNAEEIDLDSFVIQTHRRFYQNDATPPMVYTSTTPDAPMPNADAQEEMQVSWTRRFQRRLGSAWNAAWVHPQWKLEQLKSGIDAASAVTMMRGSSAQVFEAFQTPAALVGRLDNVNRSAMEGSIFAFDKIAIEPRTVMIAEALTDQLASRYPQPNDNVKLIVKYLPFVARDRKFELEKDVADAGAFIRSVDEIREDREPGLPASGWGGLPVGTFGNVPYTGEIEDPIDLSGLGLEETSTDLPDTTPEGVEDETLEEDRQLSTSSGDRTRAAFMNRIRALFAPELEWERVLQRDRVFTPMFERSQKAIFKQQGREVVKGYLKSQRSRGQRVNENPIALAEEILPIPGWGRLFEQSGVIDVRAAAFETSATEATQAITSQSFKLTREARAILDRQNFAHYVFTNQTGQDTLKSVLSQALDDGISVDETARRIGKQLGEDSPIRARRIARTEITAATQEAQIEGYRQTEVVERQMWNTSLDGDVRDSHTIEGQTVTLGEDFTLDDGDRGPAPGSVSFRVGNRANCRCFVTPVFFDEDALTVGPRPAPNEGA